MSDIPPTRDTETLVEASRPRAPLPEDLARLFEEQGRNTVVASRLRTRRVGPTDVSNRFLPPDVEEVVRLKFHGDAADYMEGYAEAKEELRARGPNKLQTHKDLLTWLGALLKAREEGPAPLRCDNVPKRTLGFWVDIDTPDECLHEIGVSTLYNTHAAALADPEAAPKLAQLTDKLIGAPPEDLLTHMGVRNGTLFNDFFFEVTGEPQDPEMETPEPQDTLWDPAQDIEARVSLFDDLRPCASCGALRPDTDMVVIEVDLGQGRTGPRRLCREHAPVPAERHDGG